MDLSLFNRFGGEATVHAAVNLLLEKLHGAPELYTYFRNVDIKGQQVKLASFFTIIMQGKAEADYAPQVLREKHAPLVAQGLDDKDYDLFIKLMEETLVQLKVPFELVEEFVELTESFRKDVLLK